MMTKKGIKQMAYRHPVGAMRLVCGAFFLALLGVCGYIGAERTHVQSVVSLPVTRVELEGEAVGGSSITQIRERLNRQREEELTLRDRGCRRRQRGKGGCAGAKDADSAPNGNGSSNDSCP